MRLSKHLKFGVFYFPPWFLVSWAIIEVMRPHYQYRSGFIIGLSYIISWYLLFGTAIPSFFLLRKRKIGIKAKVSMVIILVILVLSLTPLIYSSHLNKARLQKYVTDLKSYGIKVKYQDHFSYAHWIPTWVNSYSEFVDIALNYDQTVYISGGVPYYFFLFFPKTIEMICAVPHNGFYILRIE